MKNVLITLLMTLFIALSAQANVDIGGRIIIDVGGGVLDMAEAADGSRTYLLVDNGTIVVLDETAKKIGAVKIGEGYKSLSILPGDSRLLISGAKGVEIVSLSIAFDINIAGAPAKGNPDASVAIVVFEDFQ